MSKRILTKENLDRQLGGQSSSTPFLNIQEGYNSNKKTVLFDTQERLDDKIDKLISMMSKLSAQGSNQIDHLSPKCIKEKGEDKVEIIVTKADTKVTMEIHTVDHHIEVGFSMDKIIEKVSVHSTLQREFWERKF